MNLEITIEDLRWHEIEPLILRAVEATLDYRGVEKDNCEISFLCCDDARIAELNSEFREKPTPTNVLSWPTAELSSEIPGEIPSMPEMDFTGEIALGDVAISYDTCMREAIEAGKNVEDHVTHLIVHGVLHLLGYDHIRDPDATLMEGVEVKILGKLGVDNPYNT
ncbi:rRNA maturation RNase YbeY [Ruegeria arenilitoris]|uniref:rRNA maturation RNase YbeY n=1 Tax=Ruegeria arenilitoris TaxID=1173585 RepID=UPI00147B6D93|nr:rRNA maturation RNase YbeY [Ruegeria arenilitoris]